MGLDRSDVVDLIRIEGSSGKMILSIFDADGWEDEGAHLLALQAKMNSYIAAIESGALYESYPQGIGRVPVISVGARYPIPRAGIEFLERARAVVESAGIELRYDVLPDNRPT